MATINFSAPITDFGGNQIAISISINPNDPRVMATLANVSVEALLNPLRDDHPTGEMKMRRYELARKVNDGGEISLSVEEIAMIKDLVGKAWPPLVQGRAWELLDPPPVQ